MILLYLLVFFFTVIVNYIGLSIEKGVSVHNVAKMIIEFFVSFFLVTDQSIIVKEFSA